MVLALAVFLHKKEVIFILYVGVVENDRGEGGYGNNCGIRGGRDGSGCDGRVAVAAFLLAASVVDGWHW